MEFEMVITVKNRTISDLLDEPFAAIDLVLVAATGKLGNYLSTGRHKMWPYNPLNEIQSQLLRAMTMRVL